MMRICCAPVMSAHTCQGASFLKRSSESGPHLDGVSTVGSWSWFLVRKDDGTQEWSPSCHLDSSMLLGYSFNIHSLSSHSSCRGIRVLLGYSQDWRQLLSKTVTMSYVLYIITEPSILLSQQLENRRVQSTFLSLLILFISRAVSVWASQKCESSI